MTQTLVQDPHKLLIRQLLQTELRRMECLILPKLEIHLWVVQLKTSHCWLEVISVFGEEGAGGHLGLGGLEEGEDGWEGGGGGGGDEGGREEVLVEVDQRFLEFLEVDVE